MSTAPAPVPFIGNPHPYDVAVSWRETVKFWCAILGAPAVVAAVALWAVLP